MLPDLLHLLPLIVVVATGLIVLTLDLFARPGHKAYLGWLTAVGFVLAGFAAYWVWRVGEVDFSTPYIGSMLVVNPFGMFWTVVILLAALLSVLISVDHMREQGAESGEYYALLAFSVAGMLTVVTAADLFTLFVGIELMSMAVYVLVGKKRSSPFGVEAALKYFIMGAVGSALLLYGIALTYGVTGTTSMAEAGRVLVLHPPGADNLIPVAAMLLILAGFAFKIAAVPFHMWTPDAYEGAPTPVTAFMAAAVKVTSFAGLLRVLLLAFDSQGFRALSLPWETAVAALAAVTMTVGNLIALHQDNVKRMLAYSGVAHAGYLLMAFLAMERFAPEGQAAFAVPTGGLFYYLLVYAVANVGAFGVISLLGAKGEEDMDVSRFAGLARRRPLLAASLTVFLLSLAGIPPTAGFLGKWFVFGDVLRVDDGRYLWIVVLAVLNSLVSVYYYLRPTVLMYFHGVPERPAPLYRSVAAWVAIAAAVLLTLHAGLFPARYLNISRRAARTTVPKAARVLWSQPAPAAADSAAAPLVVRREP